MDPGRFDNLEVEGVSVVVCCYNSAHRIKPTLYHLSKQSALDFPCEVLLIDNNSTDNTPGIAHTYWMELQAPFDFRILSEPRPGTMHARKAGILGSRYRYLLFCDDDNWLDEFYLRKAFDQIRGSSAIAAVGGLGITKSESDVPIPPWVLDFKSSFGTGPQGAHDGDTTNDKGCLYTAGAIMDRIWLDKLYNDFGFKSSLKGRDGKSLVAGEDTELTFALKLIGAELHYSSKMRFEHYMPLQRLSWDYFRRLNVSLGKANFLLAPYRFHFRQRAIHSRVSTLFEKLYLFMRLYCRAWFRGFKEGSLDVVRYERAKGEMVEAFTNMDTFTSNREMVGKLSAGAHKKRHLIDA